MSDGIPQPSNVDLECDLIGSILVSNDAYRKVSTIVQADHFAEPAHQQIWSVLAAQIEKGHAATPITLKTYLGDGDFGGITPMAYLARLASASTGARGAPDYARMLRDLYLRRQMIRLGESLIAQAADCPVSATGESLFADVERDLEALRPVVSSEDADFQAFGGIATTEVYEAYQNQRGFVGLSTGLSRLDEVLNGLQNSDLIIIAGRPASGKAQPMDAMVRTLDGWTRMGDLTVGTKLASHDGRPSEVLGIYPQGERPVFDVAFSDGRSTKACAEHLWRVTYRDWEEPRVITTAKLAEMLTRKRYQKRLSIELVTGDFGLDRDMPIHPWLLGMILGNGRISGSLRLSTRDEENLSRVDQHLPPGMALSRKDTGTHSIRQIGEWRQSGNWGVNPNPMVTFLRSLGLSDEGCHTMFVPPIYLQGSRQNRVALLQGLMDSNGLVEKAGSAQFMTTSPQLAHDVQYLVRSLGGLCRIAPKATTYTHRGQKLTGRLAYRCNLRHHDVSVLFANSTKRAAATRGRNTSVRLSVASVTPAGTTETQCIRVSHPDRTYVTDDYVVTHNTSLVTNIGVHVAQHVLAQREAGVRLGPVGFSSLEMGSAQLKQRILADMASVPLQKLLKGRGDREEMEAFMRAEQDFKRLPLMIDATGGLTIAQLKLRARSLKRRHGLSLLIVDYLQLLSGTGKRDNRVGEVTEITMGLKALAKELDVPIIALSQLSRRVEERDDKRPMLSDLRESGSIEQDADSVIFVYREEYYLQQAKPREDGDAMNRWYAQMAKFEGVAEAIVAKNRHGAAGTVELGFEGQFTRFTNEPRFRAPDPEEARQTAQRIVLTSHGKALKEILQELAVNIGRRPTAEDLAHKATLPKGALLIDREEVKKLFAERVVVDLTDAEGRRKLQSASDNLRNAKLTGNYTNPESQNFIYLVELIAE